MGEVEEYAEVVREVLSGKSSELQLDCQDNAYGLPAERLEEEIADNIRCILERAGLWSDDLSIVVGPLAVDVDCDKDSGECSIVYDFTIYKDNGWDVLSRGVSVTHYYYYEDNDRIDVTDTHIAMSREEVKRLYDHVTARTALHA